MSGRMLARVAAFVLWTTVVGCGGGSSGDAASTPTGPSASGSPSDPACAARVEGLPSTVGDDGGRFTFTISVTGSCGWAARTDVPWADVAPGDGRGSATPVLSVGTNSRSDSRTFLVTVNGQTFRTVQNGVPPVVCTYTVQPAALDEAAGGGSASLAVTAPPGCGWSATASEGWIRVLTPTGAGTGTVRLELAANTGDVRHAFLIVAGQRIEVTQRRRGGG